MTEQRAIRGNALRSGPSPDVVDGIEPSLIQHYRAAGKSDIDIDAIYGGLGQTVDLTQFRPDTLAQLRAFGADAEFVEVILAATCQTPASLTVSHVRNIYGLPGGRPPVAPDRHYVAAAGTWVRTTVQADRNPLVYRAQLEQPQRVAAAKGTGAPVPTLFTSGDLPPLCASGLDPEALMSVPWAARHAIARAASTQDAYQLLEEYAGAGEDDADAMFGGDPGNVAYRQRVEQWIADGLSDDEVFVALGLAEAELEAQQRTVAAAAKESAWRQRQEGKH